MASPPGSILRGDLARLCHPPRSAGPALYSICRDLSTQDFVLSTEALLWMFDARLEDPAVETGLAIRGRSGDPGQVRRSMRRAGDSIPPDRFRIRRIVSTARRDLLGEAAGASAHIASPVIGRRAGRGVIHRLADDRADSCEATAAIRATPEGLVDTDRRSRTRLAAESRPDTCIGDAVARTYYHRGTKQRVELPMHSSVLSLSRTVSQARDQSLKSFKSVIARSHLKKFTRKNCLAKVDLSMGAPPQAFHGGVAMASHNTLPPR